MNNLKEKIELALEHFKKQEYAESIELFSEVLLEDKDNAEIYNNIALCYSFMGEAENAEKNYLRALEINPKLPQVYMNLTDLYFKQRNFTDAINLLQTGAYELPENMVIAHYLARVYMEDARADLAIDELNNILDVQPENYDAYYDLARVYFELGDYDLAISNFENVLEYKDDNELIYYNLAQAYEASDNVDKAISNHLRAVSMNDAFYPSFKKLGVLFLSRNDFDDAIEYFEEYMKFEISDEEKQEIQKTIERIKKIKG